MSDENQILKFDILEMFNNWYESEGKHKASELDVKGSMGDAFAAGIMSFASTFLEEIGLEDEELFSVHDAVETEQ